jgi:MFS family permease
VHNVRSTLILLTSSILAFAGALLMGYVSGPFLVFTAAGIFALGIAFFWPTMLGFVSENIPESGALGLAIMGGIGFLGGAIAQPVLGAIFDAQTIAAVPEGSVIEVLKAAAEGTKEAATWAAAQLSGGAHTLRYVAIVPAVLIVFFSFLHIRKRKSV